MTAFTSDMCSEFRRYATFSGFQVENGIWPSQLAREGFCRSGTCDDYEVVCFSCGVKLDVRNLAKKSLMNVHRRLSPHCAFVTGSSDNQPVPDVPYDAQAFGNLLREMEISSHSYSHPHRRNSVPYGFDKHPVPAPFSSDGLSIPILNSPFLANSNNGGTGQADLTSIPMDLIDGLANANLSSISTASMFGGAENSGLSQSAQLFSSVLDGSDDDLEHDAEVDGIEGVYPSLNPSVLQDNLGGIAAASLPVATQTHSGQIVSIEPATKLGFADLGIITNKPKYQDMRLMENRLRSLRNWASQLVKQSNESLAEAGFFYAGYSDCCRCFFCGGGLKNWKDDDDPWIEHARFFPDCPFVLMDKGKDFVKAVQSLNEQTSISMDDVQAEMAKVARCPSLPNDDLTDESFQEEMEKYDCEEYEQHLETENASLLNPELCKICMDKEVCVLFLPCGHLVTCSICAPTQEACPVCRNAIHGCVRTQRSDCDTVCVN